MNLNEFSHWKWTTKAQWLLQITKLDPQSTPGWPTSGTINAVRYIDSHFHLSPKIPCPLWTGRMVGGMYDMCATQWLIKQWQHWWRRRQLSILQTNALTIGVAEDTKLSWPDHRKKGCSVLRWEIADACVKCSCWCAGTQERRRTG